MPTLTSTGHHSRENLQNMGERKKCRQQTQGWWEKNCRKNTYTSNHHLPPSSASTEQRQQLLLSPLTVDSSLSLPPYSTNNSLSPPLTALTTLSLLQQQSVDYLTPPLSSPTNSPPRQQTHCGLQRQSNNNTNSPASNGFPNYHKPPFSTPPPPLEEPPQPPLYDSSDRYTGGHTSPTTISLFTIVLNSGGVN